MKSIPFSIPARSPKIARYALQAIKANEICKGSFTPRFERKFARTQGFKHAVACSNGTMALFLALRALGIEDGEVILPSLTFAATADAVLLAGAKPIFADIDEHTLCLSEETVARRITRETRAIITVGIYGIPARVKELRIFGVPIIEDACETLGAPGEHMADITCYSFFGNKVMTTGEGGMACTDSHSLATAMRKLRNHGRDSGYWHELRGTNARMANINAAIGLAQLEELPKNLKKRRQVLEWYGVQKSSALARAPWVLPILVKDKEKAVKVFNARGVEARVGFYPLHKMPAYRQRVSLSTSDRIGKTIVLLPCYPDLTKKDAQRIIEIYKSL